MSDAKYSIQLNIHDEPVIMTPESKVLPGLVDAKNKLNQQLNEIRRLKKEIRELTEKDKRRKREDYPLDMEMPTICVSCGSWFDLDQGKPCYECNIVYCDNCASYSRDSSWICKRCARWKREARRKNSNKS